MEWAFVSVFGKGSPQVRGSIVRGALLAAALCVASTSAAADELPCADAGGLWSHGPDEAERLARACQAQAPLDGGRILVLSQVLAWREKHAEALGWVEHGRTLFPFDLDLATLRIRLLGWLGRYDEAETALAGLPPDAARGNEALRLRANLAWWKGDAGAAVAAWDRYLERAPDDVEARRARASALLQLGDEKGAREGFTGLCRAGDDPSCDRLVGLDRKETQLFVQAGPVAADDGLDGWIFRAGLDSQVLPRLRLSANFDLQERRFGDEAARDAGLGAAAAFRAGERVLLEGGGGGWIDPAFSPRWNAWVQGGFFAGAGFRFHLKYWHLAYANAGVEVLSPAVAWAGQGVEVELRAFRGFEEDRSSLAGLARATVSLNGPLALTVGAGAGDRADYLDLRQAEAEGHVLALAGAILRLDPSWQVRTDWIGRWERAGGDRYARHELLLGLQRSW